MTYIYTIIDEEFNTSKSYTVNATSRIEADKLFISKFLPLIDWNANLDLEAIKDMFNTYDIVVNVSEPIELK